MYKKGLLTIVVLLLFTTLAHAGWSEDMRLTTRGNEFYPHVIARNDTVHVAWEQFGGDDFISYKNSFDNGITWNELVNVSQVGHITGRLDFASSDNQFFISWFETDTTGPGNSEVNLGYSISSNGGESWPVPSFVFEDGFDGADYNAASIQGNSIFVTYYDIHVDSTGYHPFRFIYSTNLGQIWSAEQIIGHGINFTSGLHIRKCQNTIYTVWSVYAPPPINSREIFVVMSFDWGQTWSDVYQLSSPDSYISQDVCIACDESTGYVVVGWMEAGFPGNLCLRVTTDGGITWGDIQQATTHDMISRPNLSIAGDTIWAVWTDHDPSHGTNNREIAFSKSTDLGYSWSPHERLTYADGMSKAPWLDYDDGKLHLVWWERNRPPYQGHDIYYKRFTPDPTAIIEEKSILPGELSLTAYPNPFNGSTTISYQLFVESDISLEVYNILGRKIISNTFLQQPAGLHKYNLDMSNQTSGLYFIRISSPDGFSSNIKSILLK